MEFNQTLARYVRLGASKLLPPDKRNVQAYILLSVMPDNSREKVSTDEELFLLATNKMKTNDVFMNIIRGVSIECLAGVSTNPELCRRCIPNGRPLLTGNFNFDMKIPSPCVPEKLDLESLLRAKVVVGDKSYEIAYVKDPFRAFEVLDDGRLAEVSVMSPLFQLVRDL